MLESFDMLFYTFAFIVPGFVMFSTFTTFVPKKNDAAKISLIRFLFFSSINYGIWSWLIYLLFNNQYLKTHQLYSAFLWCFIIFISPILIGILAGHFSNKDKIRRILQSFGFNPIHTIPASWDYKFSKLPETTWIIVTLDDGSHVYGRFSTGSFASSDCDDRDIYIEEIYNIDDKGNWTAVPRCDGILIRGENIRYIEFIADEKRSEDNGEETAK